MLVTRNINYLTLFKVRGKHLVRISLFMTAVALLYHFKILTISIPWLPISVIGAAVAFYDGFKNNQAYDRMWEARKIWGGIVNDSRAWGMMVDGYISNYFIKDELKKSQANNAKIKSIKKRLIYRHIAWLYAHRSQLLVPTEWENQKDHRQTVIKKFGVGLVDDEVTRTELKMFLPEDEHDRLISKVNTATQIINEQSRELAILREANYIDDFRHVELENVLRTFYELQGKNERIKKFPLPRQYSFMGQLFVNIFVFLLPFSMIPELSKLGEWTLYISTPLSAIIGWVYVMMNVVGENTANPYQGLIYDIPMMSLCRTIEIDLCEILEETELPLPIKPVNGVLM